MAEIFIMSDALEAARQALGMPLSYQTEDMYMMWSFDNGRKLINEFKRHA